MVTYIRSDLDFILAQIKIAEEHASPDEPLFGASADGMIPANNISWGLRTVDGTNNNLENPSTTVPPISRSRACSTRTTGPLTETVDMNGPIAEGGVVGAVDGTYAPTPNSPGAVVVDSTVRTISNLIVDQTPGNPAAVEKALDLAGITDEAARDARHVGDRDRVGRLPGRHRRGRDSPRSGPPR